MFILLTGKSKAGKTTACWKALPGLRAGGVKMAGFISPPILDGAGKKTGIVMVDLASGKHQTLAHVITPGETADVGAYRLEEHAIEWAKAILSGALLANIDWLVIDEIGPLELHRGKGFAFALEPLADPLRVPHALVIVRPELVEELAERLGRTDLVRFEVTQEDRLTAPAKLTKLILAGAGAQGAAR
jgi:nucleoside-triphosphatase THEP1